MAVSRRVLAASAMLVLGACSGDGGGAKPASNAPLATTAGPSTTVTTSVPATGSVTLSALGVHLAEPGLRVLMATATGSVRVEIRGSNAADVCPIADATTPPPTAADCVRADAATPVEIALGSGAGGVLLRPPAGTNAHLDTVAITYVPAGDSLTLVTPPLPASPTPGACAGGPCELRFRMTPTGRGTFALDADGRGGRPQLTLESGVAEGSPSRVIATVGGGGRLRVSSTLDGRSDAVLAVRNLGPATLPPLELTLAWPVRR